MEGVSSEPIKQVFSVVTQISILRPREEYGRLILSGSVEASFVGLS